MPKVSVIIPAFNAAGFIRPTIDSILNQKFTDFELILVDDGSTDGTFEFVKEVKDPRIKCFRKENGGQASARNFGLSKAGGDYIAYCDHDDRFKENHLRVLSDYLDRHPETGMVYSKAAWVDGAGKRWGEWGARFDRKRFEYFCLMIPSTAMHRRKCVEKAGGWDEAPALRNAYEDWDFFLRISDSFSVAFLDQETAIKFKNPAGHFIKSLENQGVFAALEYFMKKRLNILSQRKKGKKIAPFDGYYFYHLKHCRDIAEAGERAGAYKASEVYASKIIPLFEELSRLDAHNPEIFKLLTDLKKTKQSPPA